MISRAEGELRIVETRPNRSVVLSNLSVLTPRELDILQLLMLGERNQKIAERLFLSVHTVEYHVTHILQKLGARNRTEASTKAMRLGLSSQPTTPVPKDAFERANSPKGRQRLVRVTGWRVLAPLLLALNGLVAYIAVSGAPFGLGPEGRPNVIVEAFETHTDHAPPP